MDGPIAYPHITAQSNLHVWCACPTPISALSLGPGPWTEFGSAVSTLQCGCKCTMNSHTGVNDIGESGSDPARLTASGRRDHSDTRPCHDAQGNNSRPVRQSSHGQDRKAAGAPPLPGGEGRGRHPQFRRQLSEEGEMGSEHSRYLRWGALWPQCPSLKPARPAKPNWRYDVSIANWELEQEIGLSRPGRQDFCTQPPAVA